MPNSKDLIERARMLRRAGMSVGSASPNLKMGEHFEIELFC
jgi:hypothetical protein